MKTLLTILIGCTLFLAAYIFPVMADAPAPISDNAWKTEVFRTDGKATLSAMTSGGSITVESHERNDIIIEVYVRRGSSYLTSDDEVKRYVEVDFNQSGNSVSVEGKQISRSFWGGSGASVSYIITVPVETETDLRTSGGGLTLNGVKGKQTLRTSGGSIRLSEIEGYVQARTSGGSMRMSHIRGELDARTSGGSITLENSSGLLDVRTSGGSITLADVSGSVNARTSGGSINADLDNLDGELNLRTSGGSITAAVPSSIIAEDGAGISLSMNGSRVNVENDRGASFRGDATNRRVNGTYGNGGVRISLSTNAGTSTLRFK